MTTWFSLFKFKVVVYVSTFWEKLLENNIVKLPAPWWRQLANFFCKTMDINSEWASVALFLFSRSLQTHFVLLTCHIKTECTG